VSVEEEMVFRRIVESTVFKLTKRKGSMLSLALDFARAYREWFKRGDDGMCSAVKDAYASWGLPVEVIDALAKRIEKYYSGGEVEEEVSL